MLDFLMTFLFKTVNSLNMDHIQPVIKNEVIFNTSHLSIDVLKNALRNIDVRKDLFNAGKETAVKFYENINKTT